MKINFFFLINHTLKIFNVFHKILRTVSFEFFQTVKNLFSSLLKKKISVKSFPLIDHLIAPANKTLISLTFSEPIDRGNAVTLIRWC